MAPAPPMAPRNVGMLTKWTVFSHPDWLESKRGEALSPVTTFRPPARARSHSGRYCIAVFKSTIAIFDLFGMGFARSMSNEIGTSLI